MFFTGTHFIMQPSVADSDHLLRIISISIILCDLTHGPIYYRIYVYSIQAIKFYYRVSHSAPSTYRRNTHNIYTNILYRYILYYIMCVNDK